MKINKYDILRSLTFFSAKIISDLRFKMNLKIDYWIFTGGGVKNYTLMKDIRDILHDESLFISDELGFDSSFIESVAFAYISIRTVKGLPSAFPGPPARRGDLWCRNASPSTLDDHHPCLPRP